MDELDTIQSALSKVLGSPNRESSIFFIGSAAEQGGTSFASGLSDVDIFIVPRCESLKEYEQWLKITIKLNKELNQKGQLFDIFLLSRRVAGLHFACLSILAGRLPDEKEIIVGDPRVLHSETLVDEDFCRKLYQIKEQVFSRQCTEQFPVADTSQARKTAKFLLRFLKVLICAHDSKNNLLQVEEELFGIKNFSILQKRIEGIMKAPMPSLDVFQEALNHKTVSDWPMWMTAQEEFVYWISNKKLEPLQDKVEERFLGGVCEVRDMLMLDLKTILHQRDNHIRRDRISEFADRTSSVLVRLALSKVPTLMDLSSAATPGIVKQSYEIIVDHLKSARNDEECLAASVILLEYALEESVHKG